MFRRILKMGLYAYFEYFKELICLFRILQRTQTAFSFLPFWDFIAYERQRIGICSHI